MKCFSTFYPTVAKNMKTATDRKGQTVGVGDTLLGPKRDTNFCEVESFERRTKSKPEREEVEVQSIENGIIRLKWIDFKPVPGIRWNKEFELPVELLPRTGWKMRPFRPVRIEKIGLKKNED